MALVLDQLVTLLALERAGEDRFLGQSQDLGWGTVFGGQVLGQALSAAAQTVAPDRLCHSLHAYFLRPGDVSSPVEYAVDRLRDGGSFTTRRVVACQNGHPIFELAASFQLEEAGLEHQDAMPVLPPPEGLPGERELMARSPERLPSSMRERLMAERPFEVRPASGELMPTGPLPPSRAVWLKTVAELPDDVALHRSLLAYASDHAFLTTALLPHGVSWSTPRMQVASLDHAVWFHRPFRVDQWLLHVMESPASHGGRGLVRGSVFSRDGALVASTSQEGLIRRKSS